MIENVEHCLYRHPTPIQCYVLPAVLSGKDVIGIAQTGKRINLQLPSTDR